MIGAESLLTGVTNNKKWLATVELVRYCTEFY